MEEIGFYNAMVGLIAALACMADRLGILAIQQIMVKYHLYFGALIYIFALCSFIGNATIRLNISFNRVHHDAPFLPYTGFKF